MYNFSEIRHIHLEITSLCNARCPMCLRNVSGGKTNPLLPLKELRMGEIRKIFSGTLLSQLKRIYMCGNYGDPMLAKDTLAAFEYFRSANPDLKLQMFTNGSAREPHWWKELARIGVEIHFGIDGLGEVHSVYRRNTDFDTIVENAGIFIRAGGIAHWDFIIFKHNEHQVAAAKEFSEKLGFSTFRAKKTGRFFSNRAGEVKNRQEVLSPAGDFEYFIEMPTEAHHQNPSLKREAEIVRTYGSFQNYLDRTEIHCKVAEERSAFISAEGLLFPCCWTAIQLYPWYQKPESGQIWDLLKNTGGKSSISLLENEWETVLNGAFFSGIQSSWSKPAMESGKLKVCSRICGREFDPFKDQFRESAI